MVNNVNIEFLGGVGEFGRNCCIITNGKTKIMIDCGIMFADDSYLGIDSLLPHFGKTEDDIKMLVKSLDAILITHGHEDHVGAIPWLIKHGDVPIYGTDYTLMHIKQKFKNFDEKNFIHIKSSDTVSIKGTKVTFVAMTHSIPSAVAIAIETDIGIVLHTGDFRLDHTPVEGSMPDFHMLSSMGKFGVAALLSDSTNAQKLGWTPSEKTVRKEIDQILAVNQNSRAIFATFSSHMHRVKQIVDSSIKDNRKICVLGRSMHKHLSISKELDINEIDEKHILPESELQDYNGKVTVICTGSQGEFLAVLNQYAQGKHKSLKVKNNDIVIFSSHTIPGNEKSVSKIIDNLADNNVQVYTKVHVSGHAAQEELKHVIAITKPKVFIPIHGEVSMIKAHRKLAEDMGYTKQNIAEARTGQTVTIKKSKKGYTYNILKNTKQENVFVYTNRSLVSKDIISVRKDIARDGVIFVLYYIGSDFDTKCKISTVGWLKNSAVNKAIVKIENKLNEEVRLIDLDTIEKDELYALSKKMVYNPLKKQFGRVANIHVDVAK